MYIFGNGSNLRLKAGLFDIFLKGDHSRVIPDNLTIYIYVMSKEEIKMWNINDNNRPHLMVKRNLVKKIGELKQDENQWINKSKYIYAPWKSISRL